MKEPRLVFVHVSACWSACAGDETQRPPPAVFELSTAELHAAERHINIDHIKHSTKVEFRRSESKIQD